MPETETCEKCRFWKGYGQTNGECRSKKGECRKYAPKAIMAGSINGIGYETDWALTEAVNWCGEWEVKE